MAYQPKYARKPQAPAPQPQRQKKVPPRSSRGQRVLSAVLGVLLIPASVFAGVLLLRQMLTPVGRPKVSAPAAMGNSSLREDFDSYLLGQMEQARQGLQTVDKPDLPEPTVPRQHYTIADDAQVAPEPDQSKFGKTGDAAQLKQLLEDAAWLLGDDPMYFSPEGARYDNEPVQYYLDDSIFAVTWREVLKQLLEDAAWLLGDDPMYFSPEGARYDNEPVQYYLDDSIFAVTWREVHDGSVYTFSEVKLADPSQFRRHLAGGEYGSEMQYLTTEMAASVNAVVASAGDFYRFRDFGAVVYEGVARRVEGTYAETCYIDRQGDMHFTYGGDVTTVFGAVVYEGVARRVEGTYAETCYIDRQGDMHFTYGGDVTTVEQVQAFVDEHDINFSLAFGPVLVDDYQLVEHTWYGVGEITEGYARAALCQMAPLHYIVAAANTTGAHQDIPTVANFAKHIAATGCRMAYCLDGGQTATIVMNDALINRPVYGQQRKISDIIYFATAVPEGG